MLPARQKSNNRGFSLIEVVVSIAVLGIALLSITQLSQIFLRAERLASQRGEAAFFLQEGAEAVRFLRDRSWHDFIDPIPADTPYFLIFSGGTYALTAAEPALLDGVFRRTITVSDARRDADDDIVSSGGTLTTSTKKISIAVSWRRGQATTTETLEFFIADIFDN
jgi:prepilin-type N-terminal cleavage/methylation domain-containing protein